MKGLIYFILLIFLSSFAYSLTMSITDPSGGAVLSGNEPITASISKTDQEEITSVFFYYKNSQTDPWQEIGIDDSVNETTYSIVFDTTTVADSITGRLKANATDSNGGKISEASEVAIDIDNGGGNEAPTYSDIPNQTWGEDTIITLNLNDYFSDPDSDPLTYSVHESPTNINVGISDGTATFTPDANFSGESTVKFEASDGSLTSVSNTVYLKVTPINDPPIPKGISNISWGKGQNKIIDLDNYFIDVETTNLIFAYTTQEHITISIDEDTNQATLTPESNWTGTSTIKFYAYDGEYNISSGEIHLIVTASSGNNPPIIASYSPESNPSLIIEEGSTVSQTFIIEKSDPDNDLLTVDWFLDNTLIETDKDEYTFTTTKEGTHTIKVEVSDDLATVEKEWVLAINTINTNFTTETKTEPRCGNNIIEAGENCNNCPQDVKCGEGYYCSKEGKCTKEEKPNRWPILIILIVIIVLTIVIILIYNRRTRKEIKEEIEVKPKKEEPAKEVSDFYTEPKRIKKEPIKKEEKRQKTVKDILLKNYIESCISKNMSIKRIKESLLKKGWDQNKVEEALRKYDNRKPG